MHWNKAKALSTFSCQGFFFACVFSKLCPGGAWKANNLWVVLMEQNWRENEICCHYSCSAAHHLCCGALQTWLHLAGLWGAVLNPPNTSALPMVHPFAVQQEHRRSSDGTLLQVVLVEHICDIKMFIFHYFSLVAGGFSASHLEGMM